LREGQRSKLLNYIRSVIGRFLINVIDDKHRHRVLPVVQLQTELLLNTIEKRNATAAGCSEERPIRPLQVEVL
jgi:hypothetical protein